MLTGTVFELFLAALAFVGGHFLLSSTGLRGRIVGRLGEFRFQGVFSLAAALALTWLIWSYVNAPYVEWWTPAVWSRHLALTLMPLSLILIAASMRKDNPTAGANPGNVDIGRLGVFSITRHPMMWGIALWAALHMASNGDAASTIFFGAFLVLSLCGTLAIDSKKRARKPVEWQTLAAHTSNLPFAAIVARRTRFSGHRLAVPALIGLVLYGVLLFLHPWLLGVDPLG